VYIEVDLSAVPPALSLEEPDDFKSFKVLVKGAEHSRVPVAALEALAGERASDPQWQQGFQAMLHYADEHGWVDEGGVRAHVDLPR
jgi:hypothetical protein